MKLGAKVIGKATLNYKEDIGAITGMQIVHQEQRKGYGRQLWRFAEEWLGAKGVKEVQAQTVSEAGYRLAVSEGYILHPMYGYDEEILSFLKENPDWSIWETRPLMVKKFAI